MWTCTTVIKKQCLHTTSYEELILVRVEIINREISFLTDWNYTCGKVTEIERKYTIKIIFFIWFSRFYHSLFELFLDLQKMKFFQKENLKNKNNLFLHLFCYGFLNFVLVCYIKIFTQHISFQPQIVITLYTTQSSCIYNYLVLFMDSRNVQSILTKSYTCKFKTTSLPLKVWQTGREVLATFSSSATSNSAKSNVYKLYTDLCNTFHSQFSPAYMDSLWHVHQLGHRLVSLERYFINLPWIISNKSQTQRVSRGIITFMFIYRSKFFPKNTIIYFWKFAIIINFHNIACCTSTRTFGNKFYFIL